jgi:hypothetical protein
LLGDLGVALEFAGEFEFDNKTKQNKTKQNKTNKTKQK